MTAVQVSPQHLLLSGWLLTNEQVNITTALYDTGHTRIYITLALLFMFFFFTPLPFFWAGWLPFIPFVCNKSGSYMIQRNRTIVVTYKRHIKIHSKSFLSYDQSHNFLQ
jgi:hypothetical protein